MSRRNDTCSPTAVNWHRLEDTAVPLVRVLCDLGRPSPALAGLPTSPAPADRVEARGLANGTDGPQRPPAATSEPGTSGAPVDSTLES